MRNKHNMADLQGRLKCMYGDIGCCQDAPLQLSQIGFDVPGRSHTRCCNNSCRITLHRNSLSIFTQSYLEFLLLSIIGVEIDRLLYTLGCYYYYTATLVLAGLVCTPQET